MDWGGVYNWVGDNIVDPILDNADEEKDYFENKVVDPLKDATNDAVDWFKENAFDPLSDTVEDIGEWIENVADNVSANIEDGWENISKFAEDFWDRVVETGSNAWDDVEDAWEWLTEQVDVAVEWLSNAADKVYEFVVEEAIPYIIALVEAIPAVIKALGALLILPLCYLYKELFGEEETTILEGIAEHNSRLYEEFKIASLPLNTKYVVFSDVHMYVDGDLDFFNNNGNSEIYHYALQQYAQNNYHLIENGDVEDFWMRGGSSKGLILMISNNLPWPYFSNAFEASAFRSANQVHALNVFMNNAKTYATINALFHSKNRYTRIIGNHDDLWADPEMELLMNVFYLGIDVNDYCTLEDVSTGETEVILAHGHQSDIFNMPMCNFAGKALTNLASVFYELSFGEWDWLRNQFCKDKDKWMEEWNDKGFLNELEARSVPILTSHGISSTHFIEGSECDFYKGFENTYVNSPKQPHLILGHTHNPKNNAGVPDFISGDQSNWNEYSNSGTVGMWEAIVVGLEVDYPNIRVVAWKKEPNGNINNYTLRAYRYDYTYLTI